jgi:hypothetical protein
MPRKGLVWHSAYKRYLFFVLGLIVRHYKIVCYGSSKKAGYTLPALKLFSLTIGPPLINSGSCSGPVHCLQRHLLHHR